MKRRHFIQMTAASATAAVLPVSAAVLPGAANAAAATAGQQALYPWAVAMARAQNRASPALLAKALKISQADATAICDTLLRRGVISAPNAAGLSTAVKPIYQASRTIPLAPGPAANLMPKPAPKRLSKALHRLAEPDQPPQPDADEFPCESDA